MFGLERLKSHLALEHRIPVYKERAAYFLERATIESEPSEKMLEKARHYDRLAQSWWRRTLEEGNEIRYGASMFQLEQTILEFGDNRARLGLVLARLEKILDTTKQQ